MSPVAVLRQLATQCRKAATMESMAAEAVAALLGMAAEFDACAVSESQHRDGSRPTIKIR